MLGLLGALAAELDAGQALDAALEQACAPLDPDPCPRARVAARIGGDVPAALREDARAANSSALRALAACWEVAGRSGSGLGASVRRLAESERSAHAARGELSAELATVRASSKLLAALPLLGLLLGMGLGANPVAWLVSSWIGRGALVAGLLLQGAGLLWLQRIVKRARAVIP